MPGPVRIDIEVEGEIVKSVRSLKVGYTHKALEKVLEKRTYIQGARVVERTCYADSIAHSMTYCLAAEKLLGIEIPERAQYLRTMALELNRIASHLFWLGILAKNMHFLSLMMWAFSLRELVLDLFEMLSGRRFNHTYIVLGGVKNDVPQGFEEKCLETLNRIERELGEIMESLEDNEIFLERMKGLAVISREDAIRYGLTGPQARGSGVDYDVRVAEPYAKYDEVDFEICVEKDGDAYARYMVRMREIFQSIEIVKQVLDMLPGGSHKADIKMRVKAPPGEAIARTETPRGEEVVYMRSDGSPMPYRVKIRPPSFNNLVILPELLEGARIVDIPVIIESMDYCIAEVDR